MRRISIVLAFSLFGACSGAGSSESHPELAPTWEAWVERESPSRNGDVDGFHMRRGLPDMSRWHPEDFLADNHLNTSHADICELSAEERQKVWRMHEDVGNNAASFEEKLDYARRGFIEAQTGLGQYCLQDAIDAHLESRQFSTDDALEWARRAAASGDPKAMYRLADCMRMISRDAVANGTQDRLDPFWDDQAHYWLWRAATALHGDALMDLRPTMGENSYDYPDEARNNLYNYVWSRVWELQAIFRREPHFLGPTYMANGMKSEIHERTLTGDRIQAAESAVGEWLQTNADAWEAIIERPGNPSWTRVYCPGGPEHLDGFDFEGLNRELAGYGLKVRDPEE